MVGSQKISELTAAVTLTGTEFLPVVQSSTTRKASVDDLKLYINPNTVVDNYNYFINGNFDVWQRGLYSWTSGYSLPAAATGRYLADRWLVGANISTAAPSRQTFALGQTEVPGFPSYYHRVVVASAVAPLAGVYLAQRVEGVQRLSGQTLSWKFWAKADVARKVCVEFVQNFGSGGTPSAEIISLGMTTCQLGQTWQAFTGTVDIPSTRGQTLGTDSGSSYLAMHVWMDAGADFAGRSNSIGQQSGTFDFARMQLNTGAQILSWQVREYSTELKLGQRYYEAGDVKSFVVVPNVTNSYPNVRFVEQKRVLPTILLAPVAGTGAAVAADTTGFFQYTNHSVFATCGWSAEAEL